MNSETAEWVTLSQAAAAVDIGTKTLRRALKDGSLHGRRANEGATAPWLVRLSDVQARWGAARGAARPDPPEVAALSRQLDTMSDLVRDLTERLEIKAADAATWQAKAEHYAERFTDQPTPERRRGFWSNFLAR